MGGRKGVRVRGRREWGSIRGGVKGGDGEGKEWRKIRGGGEG